MIRISIVRSGKFAQFNMSFEVFKTRLVYHLNCWEQWCGTLLYYVYAVVVMGTKTCPLYNLVALLDQSLVNFLDIVEQMDDLKQNKCQLSSHSREKHNAK